jgi:hypothetical protein
VPDVRRLLQTVLAVAVPRYPLVQAIRLSHWRQERNRIARACHAKARAKRARQARRQQLRNTG